MSDSDGLWKLRGFPDKVECPGGDSTGEVQRAYERWLQTRRVSPWRDAERLDLGGNRYVAEVGGAHYVDERSAGRQLMCDYDVNPDAEGRAGEVVYVDSGFIPASDLPQ